jgi:hypothetical protein
MNQAYTQEGGLALGGNIGDMMDDTERVLTLARKLARLAVTIKAERLAIYKAARTFGRSRRAAALFVRNHIADFDAG